MWPPLKDHSWRRQCLLVVRSNNSLILYGSLYPEMTMKLVDVLVDEDVVVEVEDVVLVDEEVGDEVIIVVEVIVEDDEVIVDVEGTVEDEV